MAQPEFIAPDFLEDCGVDDIHERMMSNLPEDIDDTPGGFAYDFTRPTAVEKSEMLEFYIQQAIMLAFPQYSWDDWLNLHAQQVGLTRHPEQYATGYLLITGEPGFEIPAGTIFGTPSTAYVDSVEFATDEDCVIGDDGTVTVAITAVESGPDSIVAADTIILMDEPDEAIESVTNPEATSGGVDEESDDDLYDRIAAEYENNRTYLGNDSDYIRWAKEAGAGDCIVDAAAEGPGTVTLILVDQNGQPASDALVYAVYEYIVSPDDRSKRLLPTACSQLNCRAAATIRIDFTITGLLYDSTTDLEKIKMDFATAARSVFSEAKGENLLRYNDVRPIITDIAGVLDFDTFLMNGDTKNVNLAKVEYPEVGTLDFS